MIAMSDPNSKSSNIYYVINNIDTYDCDTTKFTNLRAALKWQKEFNGILTQKLNVTLQVENLQGKTVIVAEDQENDN